MNYIIAFLLIVSFPATAQEDWFLFDSEETICLFGMPTPDDFSWTFAYITEFQKNEALKISQTRTSGILPDLNSHDQCWQFLIHAETPYFERMAAAQSCWKTFSMHQSHELFLALAELEGLNLMVGSPNSPQRKRKSPEPGSLVTVLGQDWLVPVEPLPFPSTLTELETAPWPWQVYLALKNLLYWVDARYCIEEDRLARLESALKIDIWESGNFRTFLQATQWLQEKTPSASESGLVRKVVYRYSEISKLEYISIEVTMADYLSKIQWLFKGSELGLQVQELLARCFVFSFENAIQNLRSAGPSETGEFTLSEKFARVIVELLLTERLPSEWNASLLEVGLPILTCSNLSAAFQPCSDPSEWTHPKIEEWLTEFRRFLND